MSVQPYPWAALERVPRAALLRLARLREHPTRLVPAALGDALGKLVGTRVEFGAPTLQFGASAEPGVSVGLTFGSLELTLGAEPSLAARLLEHVLARPLALSRPDAPLDASARGAFAALVVEAARRVASEPPALAAPLTPGPDTLLVRTTVYVDERAYAAYALLAASALPARDFTRVPLSALGELTLEVPLVIAAAAIARAELAQLLPGTAFVPEESWVNAEGVGRAVLAAADAERGVWVELQPGGRLVLRGELAELTADGASSEQPMAEPDEVDRTLADAVLDAPVVVRVELGSVSLRASEWARVQRGDVLATGHRIAEPVLLRVGGRVVARGELVDVDGEVGVRVRELVGAETER